MCVFSTVSSCSLFSISINGKSVFFCPFFHGEVEVSVYFDPNNLVQIMFWAGVVYAGISDWKYYRLPNKVIGFECILGLISLAIQSRFLAAEVSETERLQWFLAAAAMYIVRAVLVLILGIFLSHFGLIGAGDMKLAAVFAAWFGPGKTIEILATGLLLGAILSLLKMLRDGSACYRFFYLSAYIRQVFNCKKMEKYYVPARDGTGCVIPLGACFCAGAILVTLLGGGF